MLIFLTVCLTVLLDQLTKAAVLNNLRPGESLPIIENVFHLSPVFNKGVAFGLFARQGQFFVWIVFAIVGAIIIALKLSRARPRTNYGRFILGLIMAGAIGNLIDRARFGWVIDFLDFRVWPVFNLADSAITVGTALLILRILKRGVI